MNKLWFILAVVALVVLGAVASEQVQCIKANEQGEIVLQREARVADKILPPGKYMLHSENAGGKHYVHFVEETRNLDISPESSEQFLPSHVAEAKANTENATTKPSVNAIYIVEEPAGWRITKTEIRGESHVHVF